ncbi:MAG: ATP-binding cassette domain-containing protein [Gammaproteobacteria bacterium]|nr:ATP-binding cassette domain-containing protein [Gammaproteobacteria bacterium]MYH34515.1 ATP-binding cassette domain-containing protein [Gammaproteobacteria bacterium]MYL01604.1 ATP-binding cassette domain-containing protein [Gammaproteobacteria bacterium]
MPLIELSGVSRSFEGEDGIRVDALRDVSLQINAGEFVCITGPSGAGKSTLMNILGCLDRPSSGSFRLAGREVGQLGTDAMAWLRRQIFGFVFQSYNLIDSRSGAENVELPGVYAGLSPRKRRKEAEDLLSQLGLSDRADHLPSELSGGEQQRVAIARALFNGGRIILADEPTGALDRPTGEEVLRALENLAAEGHTVILISHSPEVAARADRRIELRDGRVEEDSAAAQVEASMPASIEAASGAGPGFFSTARELGRFGLRHLRDGLRAGARLRTLLPLVCVLAAVSLGSLALSVGEGLLQDFMMMRNWMGLDIIRVGGLKSSPVTSNGVTVDDGRAIEAEIPNIRAVSPMALRDPVTIRRGEVSADAAVWGLVDLGDKSGRGPSGYRIAQGGYITQADDDNLAQVAVIGSAAHELLFASETDPLGEFILIEDVPFRVKGVLEPRDLFPEDPTRNKVENTILIVPFSTGASYLFESGDIRSINVYVLDTDRIHETAASIRDLGIRRHGHEAFSTNYPLQFLATAERMRAQLWGFLGTLAGLILLAGMVSIAFIMLMSVRTRLREIGIRMAVGARRRDIQWQFFGETLATGVVGGLLGVVVALACLPLLAYFEIPAEPAAWFFAAPFACALILNLLAAVAPARRAARLDPVEALTSD